VSTEAKSSAQGGAVVFAGTGERRSFQRRARLTKPSEFKRVFAKPMVSSDAWFKILARRDGGSGPRLGLAVSRQVDKRAVARNRIKRVVRESFRQSFADSGPAVDFVVLARRESATIPNRQLRRSLTSHWVRILERLGELPNQR
jgi:ribonuclease P protein component